MSLCYTEKFHRLQLWIQILKWSLHHQQQLKARLERNDATNQTAVFNRQCWLTPVSILNKNQKIKGAHTSPDSTCKIFFWPCQSQKLGPTCSTCWKCPGHVHAKSLNSPTWPQPPCSFANCMLCGLSLWWVVDISEGFANVSALWWSSKTPRSCLSLLSFYFFFLEYIKQHFKNSFKHQSCPLPYERPFPGQVYISCLALRSCFFYKQWPQRYVVSPAIFFLCLKTNKSIGSVNQMQQRRSVLRDY